ncbi:MAG: hypothetical protein ABH864_07065 [archaeon]
MSWCCNCRWTEIVVAFVVFVLAIAPDLIGMTLSLRLIAVASVALIIHAFLCENCGCPVDGGERLKKKIE